jgi:hypothetical protein
MNSLERPRAALIAVTHRLATITSQAPRPAEGAGESADHSGLLLSRVLGIGGAIAMIVGAKDWLIGAVGSVTPFWDQWDAEAVMFKAWLDHELSWSILLSPQNEHRLVFTRLYSLGLLWLAQYWDPVLEMVVDGLLHAVSLGLVLALLLSPLDRRSGFALCFFVGLLFAVPFDSENTLMGFSLHFYLLVAFSVVSVWLLHESRAWQPAWWGAMACTLASYFNMASGALTVAAGAALVVLQMLSGQRRGWREASGLGFQIAVLAALLVDVSMLSGNGQFKAHAVSEFVKFFLTTMAWPFAGEPSVAATFLYAPFVAVTVLTVRNKARKPDHLWFVVGVGVWNILQIAALAYGRGGLGFAYRYLDIVFVGLADNFLCVLILCDELLAGSRAAWSAGSSVRNNVVVAVGAVWMIVVVVAAGVTAIDRLPPILAAKSRFNAAETANFSHYLASGNIADLQKKPLSEIPYPSAERLAMLASLPEVRAILAPALFGRGEAAIEGGTLHRWLTVATRRLGSLSLAYGRYLIAVGLALFLVAAFLPAADDRASGEQRA